MEGMFFQMNAKFEHLENKMDTKFEQVDAKFTHVEEKISIIKWVLAAASAIITIVIAVKLK